MTNQEPGILTESRAKELAFLLAEYRAAIAEHAPQLEARLNDRAYGFIGFLVGWEYAEKEGLA